MNMPRLSNAEQGALIKEAARRKAAAEQAAQDPRPLDVDSATIQRRNDIAAALLSFYEFLTALHIPAKALKRPPPEGWDFVNAERFACLNKSDAVIDLYKHIPYITRDNIAYQIDINCVGVDYTGNHFTYGPLKSQCEKRQPTIEYIQEDGTPAWDRLEEPEHIAVLSEPATAIGYYILLDTRDGQVCIVHPRDAYDCVSGHCEDNLKEYLGHLERKYKQLRKIALNPETVISDYRSYIPDRMVDIFKGIYRKHGWPSAEFDRDACMEEVGMIEEAYMRK